MYLFGDFNSWNRTSHSLRREPRDEPPYFFEADLGIDQGVGEETRNWKKSDEEGKETVDGSDVSRELSGVWVLFLPDNDDGSWTLQHRYDIFCP